MAGPLDFAFLAIITISFHSVSFTTTTLLFALKGIPLVKYEKNLMVMPVHYFIHNIGPNLAQTLQQDHTHLTFFASFK